MFAACYDPYCLPDRMAFNKPLVMLRIRFSDLHSPQNTLKLSPNSSEHVCQVSKLLISIQIVRRPLKILKSLKTLEWFCLRLNKLTLLQRFNCFNLFNLLMRS